MKIFKRFAMGFILAILLVFTLHSKADAVADFKACWTPTGAPAEGMLVVYFSFVGEDVYSVNAKVLDFTGVVELAGSGTMVFGATETIGSMALTSTDQPGVMGGELVAVTLDMATLNLTIEHIWTYYDRSTTVIDTGYDSFVLVFTTCP